MNTDGIAEAVEEIGALLRLDGADLLLVSADPTTDRIEVALELGGADCEDCVLPSELLQQMIAEAVSRRVRGEFELVLRDPRVA